MPYKIVECLLKFGSAPTTYSYSGDKLQLWFGDQATVISSLSSVEFPVEKVRGYFDGYRGAGKFSFPDGLSEALARSDAFQAEVSELSRKAVLRIGENKLEVKSSGAGGELSEVFDCEMTFNGMFQVIPKYLKLALDKGLFAYYVEGKPLRCRGQGFDHLVTLS